MPLVIAAAFVGALAIVTTWNLTVGALFPRLAIRNTSELYGTVRPPAQGFTLAGFTAGEWQTEVSREIGAALPIYQPAVRLKNQFNYSLFGEAGVPLLAVGRSRWLYEWFYIKEYCNRTGAPDLDAIAKWADKVGDIQRYAEANGKAFIYVVTPSKAAIYPEFLPANYACAARLRSTAVKLPPYDQALRVRNIHFVDGSTIMSNERPRTAIPLFPRGGTHWNALGSAMVATEVVSALTAQRADLDLGGLSTSWVESRDTWGSDSDILGMLNLYKRDGNYPVPKMVPQPRSTTACRPARIMEVGGSFTDRMNAALLQSRCPPTINVWFYWQQSHLFSASGESFIIDQARDEVRLADLKSCDVILLEENESLIGTAAHLDKLHDLVQAASHPNGDLEQAAQR